jgi:hypothetical protein
MTPIAYGQSGWLVIAMYCLELLGHPSVASVATSIMIVTCCMLYGSEWLLLDFSALFYWTTPATWMDRPMIPHDNPGTHKLGLRANSLSESHSVWTLSILRGPTPGAELLPFNWPGPAQITQCLRRSTAEPCYFTPGFKRPCLSCRTRQGVVLHERPAAPTIPTIAVVSAHWLPVVVVDW